MINRIVDFSVNNRFHRLCPGGCRLYSGLVVHAPTFPWMPFPISATPR